MINQSAFDFELKERLARAERALAILRPAIAQNAKALALAQDENLDLRDVLGKIADGVADAQALAKSALSRVP